MKPIALRFLFLLALAASGLAASPTFDTVTATTVTANTTLNAPSSFTLAVGKVSGLGTGVATALAINTGSAGAPILFNGALGTPSSGTISGSFVSGGTLGATAGTNLTGTAASLTAGNATLAAGLSSTLVVAQGGTGRATLTLNNVLLGNGTTAVQMIAPGASGNVLASDGTTWASTAPAAGVSGANPTATIGASAVNGVATTYLRSDGAPALPATLPALSGVNLTALNATNIASGTLADARNTVSNSTTTSLSNLVTVGTLTGGATGAGFTVALSTSTITGSLADARLSANVPLINSANTFTAANILSAAGATSTPALKLSGAWLTSTAGASPQFLINDPTNSTFAGSASGTGLAINAKTGFGGNLIDGQVNGATAFKVKSDGGGMFNGVSGVSTSLSFYASAFGTGLATFSAASFAPTSSATTLGSSAAPFGQLFTGQSGFRIGNGTAGPTITASGTSPNEQITITTAGTGVFAVTGNQTVSGTSTFTGAVTQTAKTTTYNNIATVSNGIPSILGNADLTGQTAAKAATTIYTPAATGFFRVSVYLQVTTAASTSSVLGGTTGVVLTYNDGDGNVAQSDTVALMTAAGAIALNSGTNTTATNLNGSTVIYARTGVAIQYAIDYTSVGVTPMQYAAHLKVEAL